jgi:hypothetical protein
MISAFMGFANHIKLFPMIGFFWRVYRIVTQTCVPLIAWNHPADASPTERQGSDMDSVSLMRNIKCPQFNELLRAVRVMFLS